MEDVTKGAVIVKGAPSEGDLALINAQSLKELSAEDVFTFRIVAADTQVDRDFEHFSLDCLEKMAPMYVGKPVITDHQWSSSGQVARVYAASVEQSGGVGQLILRCYIPRTEASRDVIESIETGIRREVSVCVAVRSAKCGICGANKSVTYCEHSRGGTYDGKLCTVELGDPSDVYEVSFVAVPSQREAGVVKSCAGGRENAERRRRLSALLSLERRKFLEEEKI